MIIHGPLILIKVESFYNLVLEISFEILTAIVFGCSWLLALNVKKLDTKQWEMSPSVRLWMKVNQVHDHCWYLKRQKTRNRFRTACIWRHRIDVLNSNCMPKMKRHRQNRIKFTYTEQSCALGLAYVTLNFEAGTVACLACSKVLD